MKKKVLITGGTGFLGRKLAQILRDEYDVVLGARNNKQNLFAHNVTGCVVLPMDVSNIESVRDICVQTRPHIIIHAAATKFVDLAENFPMECIDINVIGSENVARVAMETGVEVVIGISTDKAAPPIRNTYGLSKALMERMFCTSDGKTTTKLACVRYGNVAWSTGSVLTIWRKMHEETSVIQSTGPEMRRFFFSVHEAACLVRTAMDNIDDIHGKILSREMKAAQIKDILAVWTKYRGGRWERIAGRPGERSDEFLIGEIELPFTREIVYNGIRHFIISFNQKVECSLKTVRSSANAERLTEAEMLELITNFVE
jgi:UDP-N-acetylglucosamine 4,6-dehydratase/5-epimerase